MKLFTAFFTIWSNEKTGAPFRATIIIDPEGTIVSKFVNPPEVGRNVYEILRVIQGI